MPYMLAATALIIPSLCVLILTVANRNGSGAALCPCVLGVGVLAVGLARGKVRLLG